jgi:hypothetical protein
VTVERSVRPPRRLNPEGPVTLFHLGLHAPRSEHLHPRDARALEQLASDGGRLVVGCHTHGPDDGSCWAPGGT